MLTDITIPQISYDYIYNYFTGRADYENIKITEEKKMPYLHMIKMKAYGKLVIHLTHLMLVVPFIILLQIW